MDKDTICKLLSGRFILTVIAGIVFAWMAIHKIIDPKDSVMIIMVVMTSYFQKKRGNEHVGEEKTGGKGK